MFVVVARWYSKEEKEQDVREILQTIVKESLSEPGCINYIANLAQDDPGEFSSTSNIRTKPHSKNKSKRELSKSMFSVGRFLCLMHGPVRYTRPLVNAKYRFGFESFCRWREHDQGYCAL
jgi:hypothetical protein